MLELIIIVLLNLGFNTEPGSHLTTSTNIAQQVLLVPEGIVITDDDNP